MPEDEIPPMKPVKAEEKPKKVTDAVAEEVVVAIQIKYPTLVKPSKHWSLTLMSIMSKIDYHANRKHCAGRFSEAFDDISYLALVQKHLSDVMLDDIALETERWVEINGEPELVEEDNDMELAELEGNTLSYTDPKDRVTPEEAASKSKEGWGSW